MNDETHLVCTLPIAASEFIRQNDQWYVAFLLPNLKGIQLSRMNWKTLPPRSTTSP
jgi:hypothetical protein